jgi:hypothetical protein
MSSSYYSTVYISPEEARRIEQERQRRLAEERRRIEEERKREEERRRQLELQQADRLNKHARDLENTVMNVHASVMEKRRQSEAARAARLAGDTMNTGLARWDEVLQRIDRLLSQIRNVEPPVAELCRTELEAITSALDNASKSFESGAEYILFILKGLDERLRTALRKAEKHVQAIAAERERLTNDLNAAIVSLDLVAREASDPGFRERAGNLRQVIHNVLLRDKLDDVRGEITSVVEAARALEAEFHDRLRAEEQRKFIAENIQSVLEEMGYEVIELPDVPSPDSSGIRMNFRIPDGEGVSLTVGRDSAVYAEMMHLVEVGRKGEVVSTEAAMQFEKQNKRWCSDYDRVLIQLRKQGIILSDVWKKNITIHQCEEMEVPRELLQSQSRQTFLKKTQPLKVHRKS